jgi:hypothetical protein
VRLVPLVPGLCAGLNTLVPNVIGGLNCRRTRNRIEFEDQDEIIEKLGSSSNTCLLSSSSLNGPKSVG